MSGVHRAERSDVERLANLLAASLVDDPFWAWVLPDPADRRPRLRAWLALRVGRVELALGEVWATQAWDAAAAWLPPGTVDEAKPSDDEVELLGDGLDRLRAVEALVADPPPGWRLSFVATDPGSRGRGLGAGVLQPGLEREQPAWGIAGPASATYLERHGFEAGVTSSDPPVTILRRPASR